MPGPRHINSDYPWRGTSISQRSQQQIHDSASLEFVGRSPIKVVRDGNRVVTSLQNRPSFEWFLVGTRAQVNANIAGAIPSGPLIQRYQTNDCDGAVVMEPHFSAYAFPCRVHACSAEEVVYFDQPVRLYFPSMHEDRAIPPCSKVRGFYNYDSDRWESEYAGPPSIVIQSDYVDGDTQGTGNVFCSGASINMEVPVFWDLVPDGTPDTSGLFTANWMECSCRWLPTTSICCTGQLVPPCCTAATCTNPPGAMDLTGIPDGPSPADDGNGTTLALGTIAGGNLCARFQAERCLDISGLAVGGSVESEVSITQDVNPSANSTTTFSVNGPWVGGTRSVQYIVDAFGNASYVPSFAATVNVTGTQTSLTFRFTVTRPTATEYNVQFEAIEDGVDINVTSDCLVSPCDATFTIDRFGDNLLPPIVSDPCLTAFSTT